MMMIREKEPVHPEGISTQKEEEEKINTTARHVPITMRESHAPTRPLEEETKQKEGRKKYEKNKNNKIRSWSSLSFLFSLRHQTAAGTAHKR